MTIIGGKLDLSIDIKPLQTKDKHPFYFDLISPGCEFFTI